LLVVVLGEVAGEHGTEDTKCGRHLLNGLVGGARRSSSIAAQGVRVNRRRIASVEAVPHVVHLLDSGDEVESEQAGE
jgi:hypothetical protein